MKRKNNPIILQRARKMRQAPTAPEAHLWQRLRKKQLDGFHFHRQYPIETHIVDFYCHQAKLIIEIEGESYAQQATYEQYRVAQLEAQGYRVIQFTDEEVMQNIEAVLDRILENCRQSPA